MSSAQLNWVEETMTKRDMENVKCRRMSMCYQDAFNPGDAEEEPLLQYDYDGYTFRLCDREIIGANCSPEGN